MGIDDLLDAQLSVCLDMLKKTMPTLAEADTAEIINKLGKQFGYDNKITSNKIIENCYILLEKFYVYYDVPIEDIIRTKSERTGGSSSGVRGGYNFVSDEQRKEYIQIYKVLNSTGSDRPIDKLSSDDLVKLNNFYKKYTKGK